MNSQWQLNNIHFLPNLNITEYCKLKQEQGDQGQFYFSILLVLQECH